MDAREFLRDARRIRQLVASCDAQAGARKFWCTTFQSDTGRVVSGLAENVQHSQRPDASFSALRRAVDV